MLMKDKPADKSQLLISANRAESPADGCLGAFPLRPVV